MFLWSWQPYFTPEDVPTAQSFMCDIHEARRFLESTFSSFSRKNRSPLRENTHCWYWFWIHTVITLVVFQLRWFSVFICRHTGVFQSHGVDQIDITIGIAEKKSSMYNSKAYLHKESINFPSLGVICGKGRERRKGEKNISEVKWAK